MKISSPGYQRTSRASLSVNYVPDQQRNSVQSNRISFFQSTATYISSRFSTKLGPKERPLEGNARRNTQQYGRYCRDDGNTEKLMNKTGNFSDKPSSGDGAFHPL